MSTSRARFRDDGQRAIRPHRPARHGHVKWWRGTVLIGGVWIEVVASPKAMVLPTGVEMEDDLCRRIEAYAIEQARGLNERGGGYE